MGEAGDVVSEGSALPGRAHGAAGTVFRTPSAPAKTASTFAVVGPVFTPLWSVLYASRKASPAVYVCRPSDPYPP